MWSARNTLSQALRSRTSAAATQEALVDWLHREKQVRIASGQGWLLDLHPRSAQNLGHPGSREVACILDQMNVDPAYWQVFEEVAALFGVRPRNREESHAPEEHQVNRTSAPLEQASRPQGDLVHKSRKASKSMETEQKVVLHEATAPRQDKRHSSVAKLLQAATAAVDPSAWPNSTSEGLQHTSDELPREAKILDSGERVVGTTTSATSANANTLRDLRGPAKNRESEESTGAATNATSVRTTRDSLSNGSHDSALSTSKSALRRRAERLFIVTKDLANEAEIKHTSLLVDFGRIPSTDPNFMPISQAPIGPRSPDAVSTIGNTYSPDSESGRRVPGDSLYFHDQESFTGDHTAWRIRPDPSPPNPASSESQQHRSRASGHQTRKPTSSTNPASGLTSIIPMFNRDCSLSASVTAGELEINLLRMVEAERQKCAMLGIPWGHQQVDTLSWVIRNVQSLVSIT